MHARSWIVYMLEQSILSLTSTRISLHLSRRIQKEGCLTPHPTKCAHGKNHTKTIKEQLHFSLFWLPDRSRNSNQEWTRKIFMASSGWGPKVQFDELMWCALVQIPVMWLSTQNIGNVAVLHKKVGQCCHWICGEPINTYKISSNILWSSHYHIWHHINTYGMGALYRILSPHVAIDFSMMNS
jgi:hypothetical protein